MKKYDTLTCGIFYCRESAEINGCGSLQTSSRVDSDVLRNRQQKHTAKTLCASVKDNDPTENNGQKNRKSKPF